jgi:hypothetical protein
MNKMITLNNGREVPVEEFLNWGAKKQAMNTWSVHYCKGKPAWNRGQCHLSDEVKKRLSELNTGKPVSQQTRDKISAAHKRRFKAGLPPNAKPKFGKDNASSSPVITPLGKFDTVKAAALAHNCKGDAIRDRARRGVEGYVWKSNPILSPPHAKAIMTPSGKFASVTLAIEYARSHGVKNPAIKIRDWLKSHPDQFYYIPKEPK